MNDEETIIRPPVAPRRSGDVNAYVIVLSGVSIGKMFKLSATEHMLGRALESDIQLDDEGVSRKHAVIARDGEGIVTLRDLGSTNGTFVNGARITSYVLSDGDRIQIGSVTILKFSYQDSLEEQFQKQLYQSATRDALTQVYNKRFFADQLDKDVSHARRHKMALSLLLLDLDHFKQVNDTYGHPAGDALLRAISNALAASTRNEDVVCRVGGEEFAIIMRDCPEQPAIVMAERMRKLVEDTRVPHDGHALHVTLSIGVATFVPERHEKPDDLFGEADKYLYDAKHKGRNCVCAENLQ